MMETFCSAPDSKSCWDEQCDKQESSLGVRGPVSQWCFLHLYTECPPTVCLLPPALEVHLSIRCLTDGWCQLCPFIPRLPQIFTIRFPVASPPPPAGSIPVRGLNSSWQSRPSSFLPTSSIQDTFHLYDVRRFWIKRRRQGWPWTSTWVPNTRSFPTPPQGVHVILWIAPFPCQGFCFCFCQSEVLAQGLPTHWLWTPGRL